MAWWMRRRSSDLLNLIRYSANMMKASVDLNDYFAPRPFPIKKMGSIRCADPAYLEYISGFYGRELGGDIVLLGFEEVTAYNQDNSFSDFWIIAHSGQGDEYLIHTPTGGVYWWDHDKGEFLPQDLLNLRIDFLAFIQVGAILGRQEMSDEWLESGYDWSDIAAIAPHLRKIWPYQ